MRRLRVLIAPTIAAVACAPLHATPASSPHDAIAEAVNHYRASKGLSRLPLSSSLTRVAQAHLGFTEIKAPFDGILTTAAPLAVPPQLVAQLRIGGRLVIPVGKDDAQQLSVVTRTENGFDRVGSIIS